MAGFPDASLHTNRALPGPSPRGTSLTSTAAPQPVFRRKARPHDCLLSSPFRSALGCHWLAADYIRTSFPLTLPFRAAQTGVHTALFLVSCLWVSRRPPRPPERASRSEEQCGDLGGEVFRRSASVSGRRAPLRVGRPARGGTRARVFPQGLGSRLGPRPRVPMGRMPRVRPTQSVVVASTFGGKPRDLAADILQFLGLVGFPCSPFRS